MCGIQLAFVNVEYHSQERRKVSKSGTANGVRMRSSHMYRASEGVAPRDAAYAQDTPHESDCLSRPIIHRFGSARLSKMIIPEEYRSE